MSSISIRLLSPRLQCICAAVCPPARQGTQDRDIGILRYHLHGVRSPLALAENSSMIETTLVICRQGRHGQVNPNERFASLVQKTAGLLPLQTAMYSILWFLVPKRFIRRETPVILVNAFIRFVHCSSRGPAEAKAGLKGAL